MAKYYVMLIMLTICRGRMLCDSEVDVCRVRCNESQNCYASEIFTQSIDTSILCEDNACSSLQIHCGNISQQNDGINIDSCVVNFAPNAINSNVQMYCNGVNNCMVNNGDSNQFLSSKLECYNNNKCTLLCPMHNSCSNSILLCHSYADCECVGIGCDNVYIFDYHSLLTTQTDYFSQINDDKIFNIPRFEFVIIVINVLLLLFCGCGACGFCAYKILKLYQQNYEMKLQIIHHKQNSSGLSTRNSLKSVRTLTPISNATPISYCDGLGIDENVIEVELNEANNHHLTAVISQQSLRNYSERMSEKKAAQTNNTNLENTNPKMNIDMKASGIVYMTDNDYESKTVQNNRLQIMDRARPSDSDSKTIDFQRLKVPRMLELQKDDINNRRMNDALFEDMSVGSKTINYDSVLGNPTFSINSTLYTQSMENSNNNKILPFIQQINGDNFNNISIPETVDELKVAPYTPVTPLSKTTYDNIFGKEEEHGLSLGSITKTHSDS